MLACHINHLIYAVITTNTTTDAADVDTDTAAALAALCAEEEHALEDFEEVRTYVTLKEEECRSLLPLHTLCRTTPIVYSSLLSSLFYFLFLSLSSHPSIPLTSSLSIPYLHLSPLSLSFLYTSPGSGPARKRKVGGQCTYVQRNEEILSVTARSRRTPDRHSSR